MTFESWLIELNKICLARFGLSLSDLPTMPLWQAYASGLTPDEFMVSRLPDATAPGDLLSPGPDPWREVSPTN